MASNVKNLIKEFEPGKASLRHLKGKKVTSRIEAFINYRNGMKWACWTVSGFMTRVCLGSLKNTINII